MRPASSVAGREEGRVEGRVEGEALGEAKSVLLNLKNRGVPVDPHPSDRIKACTDIDALDRWMRLSLTVAKVTELFND